MIVLLLLVTDSYVKLGGLTLALLQFWIRAGINWFCVTLLWSAIDSTCICVTACVFESAD